MAKAPANFATIKHMAGNLLRHGAGKQSRCVKRRVAEQHVQDRWWLSSTPQWLRIASPWH